MCIFNFINISGEERPVSGPVSSLWDIFQPQGTDTLPAEVGTTTADPAEILLPGIDDDGLGQSVDIVPSGSLNNDLGALSDSTSSETVKAAPSPAVGFITTIASAVDFDRGDVGTTNFTEFVEAQEAVEDARGGEFADDSGDVPGHPANEVHLFTALIDLTDDEEFDERSEALHVAHEASQLRNDAHINILNRLIDDLEADKARLSSALFDLESKQLLSEDRICALSADVHDLTSDRSELRGALAKVKAAYAAAQVKTEADRIRIAKLKLKLAAVETQLQQLHHDHHEAHTMISTLSHSLDEHKSALEDVQAHNRGLRSQMYEEREIAQGTRGNLAAVQNALVDLKGQLEEQAACAREAVTRQDQIEVALEEARSLVTDALGRAHFFEERAAEAAEAYDALYQDNETLSHRLCRQERLTRKVQHELSAAEGRNGSLEAELVIKKASLTTTNALVQEVTHELEETRSALHCAKRDGVDLKHDLEAAQASVSVLNAKVEALGGELATTKAALSASGGRNTQLEAQLEDERQSSAARITMVEREVQERLDQQQARHQEELTAAENCAKEKEAAYKAEIARLQDLLAQTNTAFNHVLVQTSALAEREEVHLATQAALAKERRAVARKNSEIQRLRQENVSLNEHLETAERTSFKLDEELGNVTSRVNAVLEEKRIVVEQLAEKSVVVDELQKVNQKMGIQMEDAREQLAALYEEHETTRSLSEVSIDEVRQLKSDFEERTCETLESVLTEKEQLRAEKKAAEKELVRVRRESQVKIDSFEKDNIELRLALLKKPQSAELYETKKLIGVYTERIANCSQCAIISTPAARFKSRGKENFNVVDDSLFSVSVDNILANLSFTPRSPLVSRINS
ncbi:uncharacterized protein PHACADRAFT_194300 [Phanerochaete carnosa HHB-10118-sp]|uniref:Uncharacterized protein n=1 Tax=Phanerochaete carnosa (strain HHB-10118-sp) TaxID=650164 RepID=K5WCI1_PHACS|nr:uncharacterized protein PHACADRAFT_194300 [Phanerochaete carnosa HHB-10118-sp]EKM56714.1 hypothetical protein PHACADRAFT_194300 [Phanerochaete carnosa HHB-10118-sp]